MTVKLICKTTAFMMGIAAGVYVAMNYEDEIDDISRYYGKTKRKMKHSLRAMDHFFD